MQLEIVPVSSRGTITIPKNLREKYDIKSPGNIQVLDTDKGVLVKPSPDFFQLFGAVKHRGNPLDFNNIRDEFESEIADGKS